MKRAIYLLILSILPGIHSPVSAQTPGTNHIVSQTYTAAGGASFNTDVTYYNGLGYPLQTVHVGGSPSGGSLVQGIYYDALMRDDARIYLPVATATASADFVSKVFDDRFVRKYIENVYENSTRNRILQTKPRGYITQYKSYLTVSVSAADEVYINGKDGPTFNYGQAFMSTTQDEDGNRTEKVTDLQGRTLMTGAIAGSERLRTYYIHNEKGLLTEVRTPAGNTYKYAYDTRNRLTSKSIPGKNPEHFVYDQANRIVMRQDGKLAAEGKWMTYRYDPAGRLIETGTASAALTPDQAQSAVTAQPDYTAGLSRHIECSYTYDQYPSSADPALQFLPEEGVALASDKDSRVKGYKTYEKIAVIGTEHYVERAYYYDYLGREIQCAAKYPDGSYYYVSCRYDFSGNPLTIRERYRHSGSEDIVYDRAYGYDSRGRTTSFTATIPNGTPARVEYAYDAIGRLVQKTYQTERKIDIDYSYTIQDWLTEIRSPVYGQTLRYNVPEWGARPSYTGKITEWVWHQKAMRPSSCAHTYTFEYDNLSRMTAATLYDMERPANCQEEQLVYDKDSHISKLTRDGVSYDFQISNSQVKRVSRGPADAGLAEYRYDPNGNQTFSPLNNLSISYNFLNLPQEVREEGTLHASFRFLADGTKYQQTTPEGLGYCYIGSLVFALNKGVKTLESAEFPDGRIRASYGNSPQYNPYYFIRDHLGSVRVEVDQRGTVKSTNDYYPFGLQRPTTEVAIRSDNRYEFNGKERLDFGEQYYLDYGARLYDPVIGRWISQDPLAEKYYAASPYTFCAADPVNNIDPDGKDVWEISRDGEIVHRLDDATQDAFYIVEKECEQWKRTGQFIAFKHGTVTGVRTPTVNILDSNGEIRQTTLRIFEVRGD